MAMPRRHPEPQPWREVRTPKGNPRVSPDLVEYLKEHYPPRCIESGQTEIDAHRYAAKVELAQTIIKFGAGSDDHRGFSFQED